MKTVSSFILLLISTCVFSQETSISYDSIVKLIQSGMTTTLKEALEKEPIDVNQYDRSQSIIPLLHHACSSGHKDMVQLLLTHGANPNTITHFGTAAHWAMEKGHSSIVVLLLESGFNPRIEEMAYWVKAFQKRKSIPVWFKSIIAATLRRQVDFKDYSYLEYVNPSDPLLLAASIMYDKSGELILTKRLIKAGINVNMIDNNGTVALHSAVQQLNVNAIKLLIRHGANVNQPIYRFSKSFSSSDRLFRNNLTPLHLLVMMLKERPELLTQRKEDVYKIIKTLRRAGANPDLQTKIEQHSVIDKAQDLGDSELLKALL